MYEIITNVKENAEYRASFNRLAERTFELGFEEWYQNGFWNEKYIPYTCFDGKRAVANVSVNIMDFELDGIMKHYVQLGTVMTDEAYRNRGLIRKIMEKIEEDFPDVDGMYLFANDSVLEFYPKFGFQRVKEYQYSVKVKNTGICQLENVPMDTPEDLNRMKEMIKNSISNGTLYMRNADLDMFYLSQFMKENVFYSKKLNVYAVVGFEENTAVILDVFSEEKVDMEQLFGELGSKISRVVLAFTPENTEKYEAEEYKEEDTTLFMRGGIIKDFEGRKLMFPALSHA